MVYWPPVTKPDEEPRGEQPPARSVFINEAASLLGVSRRTVYYRIREGQLRTVRTRCGSQRVLIESVEALLRAEMAARLRRAQRPSR